MGLDLEAYDDRNADHIRRDFSGGIGSGVNGTPTLFIDRLPYDVERDVDSIVAAMNEAAEA